MCTVCILPSFCFSLFAQFFLTCVCVELCVCLICVCRQCLGEALHSEFLCWLLEEAMSAAAGPEPDGAQRGYLQGHTETLHVMQTHLNDENVCLYVCTHTQYRAVGGQVCVCQQRGWQLSDEKLQQTGSVHLSQRRPVKSLIAPV